MKCVLQPFGVDWLAISPGAHAAAAVVLICCAVCCETSFYSFRTDGLLHLKCPPWIFFFFWRNKPALHYIHLHCYKILSHIYFNSACIGVRQTEKIEGIFFWMLMSVQINNFSNLGYEDRQKDWEVGGSYTSLSTQLKHWVERKKTGLPKQFSIRSYCLSILRSH